MGNGTHEKGLKDEGLGFGFHVSAALPMRRRQKKTRSVFFLASRGYLHVFFSVTVDLYRAAQSML